MDERVERIKALEKRLAEAREKAKAKQKNDVKKRTRSEAAAQPKEPEASDKVEDPEALLLNLGAVRSALLGTQSEGKKKKLSK